MPAGPGLHCLSTRQALARSGESGRNPRLTVVSTTSLELGPRMVGKNLAEIAIEGRQIHDEIREVLDNNIANYQSEKLPTEPEKQQAED